MNDLDNTASPKNQAIDQALVFIKMAVIGVLDDLTNITRFSEAEQLCKKAHELNRFKAFRVEDFQQNDGVYGGAMYPIQANIRNLHDGDQADVFRTMIAEAQKISSAGTDKNNASELRDLMDARENASRDEGFKIQKRINQLLAAIGGKDELVHTDVLGGHQPDPQGQGSNGCGIREGDSERGEGAQPIGRGG